MHVEDVHPFLVYGPNLEVWKSTIHINFSYRIHFLYTWFDFSRLVIV